MSDSPSASRKKPARPLNRWGMGTLSVLQTLLLAVIVVAANYLSVNHHARLDLSRAVDYSLSPSTTRYLKSDVVRGR